MNNQEIFDTVVFSLYKQGSRSYIYTESPSDGLITTCGYYGSNGRKCAIGHLIPPHLYSEMFEKQAVIELIQRYSFINVFGFNPENDRTVGLLEQLQGLHDRNCGFKTYEYKKQAKEIASRFGLSCKILASLN